MRTDMAAINLTNCTLIRLHMSSSTNPLWQPSEENTSQNVLHNVGYSYYSGGKLLLYALPISNNGSSTTVPVISDRGCCVPYQDYNYKSMALVASIR